MCGEPRRFLCFEGHLTVEKDVFNQTHIPYADIEQIVFGPVPEPEKVRLKQRKKEIAFAIKEKGYFGMVDVGFLVRNGGYYSYEPGVSITAINGHAFNPHVRVGLGLGVDSYGYNNMTTAPVFLSLSGLVNQRRWSPFYFLNAGGSFAWFRPDGFSDSSPSVNGGLMGHAGIGYRYNIGRTGVAFGVGYKIQKSRLRYGWSDWNTGNWVEVDERRTLRRLSMTVGVHF